MMVNQCMKSLSWPRQEVSAAKLLFLFFLGAPSQDIWDAGFGRLVELELVNQVLHALVTVDGHKSSIFNLLSNQNGAWAPKKRTAKAEWTTVNYITDYNKSINLTGKPWQPSQLWSSHWERVDFAQLTQPGPSFILVTSIPHGDLAFSITSLNFFKSSSQVSVRSCVKALSVTTSADWPNVADAQWGIHIHKRSPSIAGDLPSPLRVY